MLNTFSFYFRKLDFLGPPIGVENEDSNRLRSNQGAFLSFLTFLAAFIIAIMFGQEVYQRKNPNVSESKEFVESSKVYFKDFPALFTFHYGNTEEVANPYDFYDFWIQSFHIDANSTTTIRYNYSLVDCETRNFTIYNEILENQIFQTPYSFYCINFTENDYFSNDFTTPNSVYFRMLIELCDVNDPSRNCKLTKEVFTTRTLVVSMTYINTFVDTINFEKPVVPFIERFVQPISWGLFKLIYFQLSNNIIISDAGWLLEDKQEIHYLSYKGKNTDMNLIDFNYGRYVYALVFESPRLRIKIQRTYMKVQELFARVGGIANAFVIIITIASNDYIRYLYYFFIKKHSFESNSSNDMIKLNSFIKESSHDIKLKDNLSSKEEVKISKSNKDSNFRIKLPEITAVSRNNLKQINDKKEYIDDENDRDVIKTTNKNFNIKNNKNNFSLSDKSFKKETENKELCNSNLLLKSHVGIESNLQNFKLSKLDKEDNHIKDISINVNKNNISKLKYPGFLDDVINGLFLENAKDSKKQKEFNYLTYVCVRTFKCCYKSDVFSAYENDVIKIKSLLDARLFSTFLLQQYNMLYKNE